MKILVLGISGMLGSAMFRFLSLEENLDVFGTARSSGVRSFFNTYQNKKIIVNVDVENQDSLEAAFYQLKPDVVINCVGLIKQLAITDDPLAVLPVNSMLPHRLARLCGLTNSRLIHISTDCVFSGKKGNYLESDLSDAEDLYGKSKFIGEVVHPHCLTLRTSVIGHELSSNLALINWFLSQSGTIRGYTKAIFSGLPTVEVAKVIKEFVLPRPDLYGLYHLSSDPIDKYNLLKIVATVYQKTLEIIPDNSVVIDRSLNSHKFKKATGYEAPSWGELINRMYEFR